MIVPVVLLRLVAAVLPRMPSVVVSGLARLTGWSAWLANANGRRAVRSNLSVVLGREPSSAEVRSVFLAATENYFDLFAATPFSDDDLMRRVDVEGWENLENALSQGRGALIAALHLGNIEVVGQATTLRGIEVVVPVERVEPPALLELMLALRRRAGLACEPVGVNALARVRDALHRKAVVGLGADRITLGAGELVTFCGRPARMPIAAALLALRTGAPLLPYGCQRLPGHRFRVQIGRPIPITRGGNLQEDVRLVTERLLEELAMYLRANPTQWVVFRKVWTTECPA